MITPKSKPDAELTLQDELNRKVLSALESLDLRYQTGQITESQLEEALQAVYRAVFGLVTDNALQDIMDAYEPTVTSAKAGYFTRVEKGSEHRFVVWVADTDHVDIIDSYTGDTKVMPRPKSLSPHEFYEKVIAALNIKGWVIKNVKEQESEH